METGIVLLNYGNYLDTQNCIESVLKYCDKKSIFLVVVDNGSLNDSVQFLSIFFKQLQPNFVVGEMNAGLVHSDLRMVLLTSKINLGYAQGNNLGINFLLKQKVENILILNNDILLTCPVLPSLIKCLKDNRYLGIVSPLLTKDGVNIDYSCCRYNPTKGQILLETLSFFKLPFIKRFIDKKYILLNKPKLIRHNIIPCDIISGSCILASAKTWSLLNGFDPNTFLYYEENILYEKLKEFNLTMAIVPKVNAIHLGARSTNKLLNVRLLRFELESLKYYLKEYRNASFIYLFIIYSLKEIRIILLSLYNRLK